MRTRDTGDPLAASRPDLADLVDGVDVAHHRTESREGDAPLLLPDDVEIATEEIERTIKQSWARTLDVAQWERGLSSAAIDVLQQQIEDAARQEDAVLRAVRDDVLPEISRGRSAPAGAGVYRADLAVLEQTQRDVLFNGGAAAVDGSRKVHDTLPLTIIQIGVALVTYAFERGAWTQQIFRQDLRAHSPHITPAEIIELLQRRRARGGLEQPDKQRKEGQISELLTRGLMSHSERAVLAYQTNAPWRIGHGRPAPYELLTGSGNMPLLHAGLDAVENLVLGHERFIYVPSADGDRLLLTLGMALRPLEYAIVHTDLERMRPIIEQGNLRGDHRKRALRFLADVGPKIVAGVYRTYAHLPAQVFYAHADHAHHAALVAMADSILEAHRGFPMLIDLAHTTCTTYCGMDTFGSAVEVGYARTGTPLRYFSERDTRG